MKFKQTFGTILISILSVSATVQAAQPEPTIRLGNVFVKTSLFEKLARKLVAESLGANFNQNRYNIQANGFEQNIRLPAPSPDLKQIFDILGVKESVEIIVSPIHASFGLSDSAFKLGVQAHGNNTFLISAEGTLTNLNARVNTVAIKVPAGLFDRPFAINSTPVQITLAEHSPLIQFETTFLAELTSRGVKIHVNSFKTNLSSRAHPNFKVGLGTLTVNGKPFSLDIQTDGQKIHASEASLRAQFQTLEPSLSETIRTKLVGIVATATRDLDQKFEAEPALKYSASSDDFLAKLNLDQKLSKLLGGIDFEIFASYLQNVNSAGLYSIQLATQLCFDGKCITDSGRSSPVGAEDLKSAPPESAGVVVYESFIQNFIESPEFQRRIRNYYETDPSPGVVLAPAGVKVSFDPAMNSVIADLNLEIDIKKTIKSGTPFGKRIEAELGDVWEQWFGSGRVVKIPVELAFHLQGIQKDAQGKEHILFGTQFPFPSEGHFSPPTHCSNTECPNNVDRMTDFVKKTFLKNVQQDLQDLIPATIPVPLSSVIKLKSINFVPQAIELTVNHGLLLTGKLTDSSKGK